MGATIKDIAKAAGVSSATVSKVLHDSGANIRVSKERAEHIREVAHKLNYVPNVLARNLRKGATRNIGLVFENFGSIAAGPLYYAEMFDGITSVLFAEHYRLTILPEIDPDTGHKELANGQLDGVIWCKFVENQATNQMLRKAALPCVALNTLETNVPPNAVSVMCDNLGGAELVVDHLTQLGHTQIAFVNEIREEETPDSIGRLSGFIRSMNERGLAVHQDDILTWSFEATEFVSWWAKKPPHTALFIWNEGQASRVLRRALDAGVEIPRELSVVGFDSTAFSETTHPPLTAVNQPIREMARYAANVLLNLISGQVPESHSVTFPVTLDVRGSTQALTQSRVSNP
ncbi:MAG: LacI family DNA-binding transcriptional regulator [Armatimonadetes bacterium]|nr:LacI family DNA-binding transcriptional regulator [Armatimonadota bacterium]